MKRWSAILLFALAVGCVSAPTFASRLHSGTTATSVPTWEELDDGQRTDLADFASRWDSIPPQRRLRILRRHDHWRNLPESERRAMREGVRNFRRMPPRLRMKMRASLAAVRELSPAQQRSVRGLWRSMTPAQRREWLEHGGPGLIPPPTKLRRDRQPPG